MKAEFKDSNKEIEIRSNYKVATVWNFGTYWNLTYQSNGQGKNFKTYQDVINHLQSRGW